MPVDAPEVVEHFKDADHDPATAYRLGRHDERSGTRSRNPNTPKKTIYTLVVDDYAPQITDLTFPLMAAYADKIGAELVVIRDRLCTLSSFGGFHQWPVTLEKFQTARLARERGDDWSIFIDADTLINPEFFDVTEHLPRDTVAHNGKDMAGVRWTYDEYFRRDGRHFGSCSWLVIASSWCVEDLWRLPELSYEETLRRIHITIGEHNSGNCRSEHLIDDYTLSRNIARFGLKTDTVTDICGRLGWKAPDGKAFNPGLWHQYTISVEDKVRRMLGVLSAPQNALVLDPRDANIQPGQQPKFQPHGIGWGVMTQEQLSGYKKKWKIK
jgi:hypothetical protein